MPARILTPEQVVAEMSALTESLRTGVHVSSSLGENIIVYTNYIQLFDRGHKRTVGWNAGGDTTTKLRPEDSDINLRDVGGTKCPELFQPVRKAYVVQYFKTVFTPLFHNMEADLQTYRAQYAQYLTQMTEYRNTTGNVISIRPRAPRRPQCGVTSSTAFGSSIRTLDFFLYKQLRSRLSSIIYSIRGDCTEANLQTKLNDCRTAANGEMTTYWGSIVNTYIGVKLVNDFTMTDPGAGAAPQAVVPAGVVVGGGGGGAVVPAVPAQPTAYEKDCKKRQSGHRILIMKDDRSVRRDPCIYASPEYTTVYRNLQQHYETVYQEMLQRFTDLETQDRATYNEERKHYDEDREKGLYAELPRRVSRKKEWNEAIHALTEEMRRIIITPPPPAAAAVVGARGLSRSLNTTTGSSSSSPLSIVFSPNSPTSTSRSNSPNSSSTNSSSTNSSSSNSSVDSVVTFNPQRSILGSPSDNSSMYNDNLSDTEQMFETAISDWTDKYSNNKQDIINQIDEYINQNFVIRDPYKAQLLQILDVDFGPADYEIDTEIQGWRDNLTNEEFEKILIILQGCFGAALDQKRSPFEDMNDDEFKNLSEAFFTGTEGLTQNISKEFPSPEMNGDLKNSTDIGEFSMDSLTVSPIKKTPSPKQVTPSVLRRSKRIAARQLMMLKSSEKKEEKKFSDPDLAIIEMDRAYSQRLMTI